MTHLQITERKDNREYRASDVMTYFGVCEKKRAEQRFSPSLRKPLYAHHARSSFRRRYQPSQIERLECHVASEFS